MLACDAQSGIRPILSKNRKRAACRQDNTIKTRNSSEGMRSVLFISLMVNAYSAEFGKIYAAGSGQNMLSLPETISEIIELSGKKHPHVLYLGTATYDNPSPQKTQTQSFLDQGCTVAPLEIAVSSPSMEQMRPAFLKADIITVEFSVHGWWCC